MTIGRPHSPRARRLLAAAVAAAALQLPAAPSICPRRPCLVDTGGRGNRGPSTGRGGSGPGRAAPRRGHPGCGHRTCRPCPEGRTDNRRQFCPATLGGRGPGRKVHRCLAGRLRRRPPVTGTFPFTTKTAAGGQAPPKSNAPSASMQSNAPSPPPQSNAPAAANEGSLDSPRSWLLLGGALVLAGGVGVLLWRWLRRRTDVPSP